MECQLAGNHSTKVISHLGILPQRTVWNYVETCLVASLFTMLCHASAQVNELILEVVDKDGKPVSFQADSSMGQVEVPFFRTLIHSAFPNCSLPLLLQLILLLGGSVALGIHLLLGERRGLSGKSARLYHGLPWFTSRDWETHSIQWLTSSFLVSSTPDLFHVGTPPSLSRRLASCWGSRRPKN